MKRKREKKGRRQQTKEPKLRLHFSLEDVKISVLKKKKNQRLNIKR